MKDIAGCTGVMEDCYGLEVLPKIWTSVIA